MKSGTSLGDKNDTTKAVLLLAHHEKAGLFGKDNNAGKTEGGRKRGGQIEVTEPTASKPNAIHSVMVSAWNLEAKCDNRYRLLCT